MGDGVVFDFMTGDEGYGACPDLWAFRERIGQVYVLRGAKTFPLDFGPRGRFTGATAVKEFASARSQRRAYPAAQGSKDTRAYAWTWFDTASPGHTLPARRHRATAKLAFYYCWTPPGQQVTLRLLIRAAGPRWPAEECFALAKDDFGLDQSQVRTYKAIRHHTTPAAAALAGTAVATARLHSRTNRRARPAPPPTRTDQTISNRSL